MASEWVEGIKKELFEPTSEKTNSSPVSVIPDIKPKTPLFDKYSQNLFLLVLSVTIFLVAAYQDKTGVRLLDVENWNLSEKINNAWVNFKNIFPKSEPKPTVVVPPVSAPVVIPNSQFSKDLDKFKTDLEKFQKELEETRENLSGYADHQRLLAIIINNNAVALRNNRPNDTILLNEDWTITKLPPLLFLDAEDIEFISKFVKSL